MRQTTDHSYTRRTQRIRGALHMSWPVHVARMHSGCAGGEGSCAASQPWWQQGFWPCWAATSMTATLVAALEQDWMSRRPWRIRWSLVRRNPLVLLCQHVSSVDPIDSDKSTAARLHHRQGVCGLLETLRGRCAPQAAGGGRASTPDVYGASPASPEGPKAPARDPRQGYAGSLLSESFDGGESSFDDGTASVQFCRIFLINSSSTTYINRDSARVCLLPSSVLTKLPGLQSNPVLRISRGVQSCSQQPWAGTASAHVHRRGAIAGMPTAETPAPSSHNTSITDAVMSLPDLLRARSAQLVGALELGAPLGRGSFGKVYKGALPPDLSASRGSCILAPSWQHLWLVRAVCLLSDLLRCAWG